MKRWMSLIILVGATTLSWSQSMYLIRKDRSVDSVSLANVDRLMFHMPALLKGDACATIAGAPAAFWRFDGSFLDTVNLTSGISIGPASIAEGAVGSGLSLEMPGYVFVSDSSFYDITSSFTISLWMRLNVRLADQATGGWQGDYPFVIEKGNADYRYRNYALYFSKYARTLIFNASDTSQTGYVFMATMSDVDTVFNDLDWHHVAATWDRTTRQATIFVDGVVRAVAAGLDQDLTPNAHSLRIGSALSDRYWFEGSIDELALYKRSLSAAEIQAIVAAGTRGICY